MEDEEGYTALSFQARRNALRTASPAKKQVPSQVLHWQFVTLWVVFTGTVILVVAVRVLASQLADDKGETSNGTWPVKCNCSSDNFQSLLRSRICNQSKGNSPCQICPPLWHLHQGKCYWASKDLKSWTESQGDCSARGAQLAVIQDRREMEFLKMITEDTHRYWIGLSLSETKWRWITGHQLDHNMFQGPLSTAEEDSCGTIKGSTISPDFCTAVYQWICQKDPILL
ncbi:killer cell lectin-like receptor subfamily F member 1 isoform X2 [Paroedura picta]|uniref:killer cell lectin-like receptor subfamily F member 1 isoform X2 n=1 Tax=Paroedura picta TaxID=143630 RepID=UPI004057C641